MADDPHARCMRAMRQGTRADMKPSDCDNWQRCHGPQRWCDLCGDVGALCTHEGCSSHTCETCGLWPLKLSDMTCESCLVQETIEWLEAKMLKHAERGEEELERGTHRELTKLLDHIGQKKP